MPWDCVTESISELWTAWQKNTVCYRSNIRRNGECRGIALQKVYLSSGQRGRKIPYATGVTYGETANAVGLRYRKYICTLDSVAEKYPASGKPETESPPRVRGWHAMKDSNLRPTA